MAPFGPSSSSGMTSLKARRRMALQPSHRSVELDGVVGVEVDHADSSMTRSPRFSSASMIW